MKEQKHGMSGFMSVEGLKFLTTKLCSCVSSHRFVMLDWRCWNGKRDVKSGSMKPAEV